MDAESDGWLRGGDRDAVPQNQGNNLHVSGLAKSVDVAMLEDVFGKIGKVSFGRGYLSFHTNLSADHVCRSTRPRS